METSANTHTSSAAGRASAYPELAYRVLDLLVVLLVLPLALPMAAAIAVAILADSPGPIVYRCRRLGQWGRPFQMLKFRKMRDDADGPPLTSYDDERFTPIGKFLTATRLDELPQLWNVVKGDMSLVGPRPEVDEFVALYPREYGEILTVRPGLTGLAQVEFFQEGRTFPENEDPAGFYAGELLPRKLELDLAYIRSRTIRRDFWIIARTVVLPLRVIARAASAQLAHLSLRQVGVWMVLAVSAIGVVAAYAAQA